MNIIKFDGSIEDLYQKFLSEGKWLNLYLVQNFYYTRRGTVFGGMLSFLSPTIVDATPIKYKRIIKVNSKEYKVISERYINSKVHLTDNLKPLEIEYEVLLYEEPTGDDGLEKKPRRIGTFWSVSFCKIEKGLVAYNEDVNSGKFYFKWEDNRNRGVLLEFDLGISTNLFFGDYDMQISILDLCKKIN